MDSKRKRTENWNDEDKMLLKELVKERVREIENKNTDTNTNKKKKKAWEELEVSFNSLCKGIHRNVGQLKTQWTSTKVQARKEMADHRREIQKTGGGPQPLENSLSANDISVWLPNEFVIDDNEFDSDVVVNEIAEQVSKEKQPSSQEEAPPNEKEAAQDEKEKAQTEMEAAPPANKKVLQKKKTQKRNVSKILIVIS